MRDLLTLRGNDALLTRANPLSKLVAVLLPTFAIALSIDWVSAAVALALGLAVFPLAGMTFRLLWQRGWPLIIAALIGGLSTAAVGRDSGRVLFGTPLWDVTEGSLALGAAMALRGLAIALPALLMMSCTDPTDLADALAQRARLPHRFVLGTLAALRLVGLMVEQWQILGLARRARGVGAQGGPVHRVRALLGQSFGLLVQSIRLAARLAVTMEARGFGGARRTWARPSRFSALDLGVVAGGIAFGALSVGAAVAAGTWNVVWAQ